MRHGAAFLRPAAPLLDKALPSARVELLADGIHLHGGMESLDVFVEVTAKPAQRQRNVLRALAARQAQPCPVSSIQIAQAITRRLCSERISRAQHQLAATPRPVCRVPVRPSL